MSRLREWLFESNEHGYPRWVRWLVIGLIAWRVVVMVA